MKHLLLRAIFVLSVLVAIATGVLFIVTEVKDSLRHRWFSHQQWPLGKTGGVIVSGDAVFVGAWYDGRVYKFDFNGQVLDWFDNHGAPIWIEQHGDSIVINYSGSGRRLDQSGFRVTDAQGRSAEVVRTWYGQPLLVVRGPGGTRTVPLQSRWMTLFQHPYPAGVLVPICLGLILLARWLYQKQRNS